MSKRKKPAAVREPLQVYLTEADRAVLDRVAAMAGLPRAEILRRGLRRYASEALAESHPVVAFLDEMAAGDWPVDMPPDVSARHDDYLTDDYAPAPASPTPPSPTRRGPEIRRNRP